MTQAAATPVLDGTALPDAAPAGGDGLAGNEWAQGELVEEDLLVEEISIDGMCGVY